MEEEFIAYKCCLKIGYFSDGPWAHQAFMKLINDKTIKIFLLW